MSTLRTLLLLLCFAIMGFGADPAVANTTLSRFVTAIREKAKTLEGSTGMRSGYRTFTAARGLQPGSVRYSDYVTVRLLFEATRDAGFWNLHWAITDMPPNSDNIWRQWAAVKTVSALTPTATAECDELSALYAFLVRSSGVRGVGLFWPTSNHTIAVWALNPPGGMPVRVIVPTTQIFLGPNDYFGTRRFDAWRQKRVYEYTRRDVPDSFVLPKPLFDFMLLQIDKYAGASDGTLQRLRYLREGIFLRSWTPESAARQSQPGNGNLPAEDLAALKHFVEDMRSRPSR